MFDSSVSKDATMSSAVCMEPNVQDVLEIVKENVRFSSPFSEPNGYYIWSEAHQMTNDRKEDILQFYLEKLKYASVFADVLIQNVFQPDFYEFYGVDHDVVRSPEEMCKQLIFDSFVLVTERKTIEACLSNVAFMPGHYIECRWDYDWNLVYWEIC